MCTRIIATPPRMHQNCFMKAAFPWCVCGGGGGGGGGGGEACLQTPPPTVCWTPLIHRYTTVEGCLQQLYIVLRLKHLLMMYIGGYSGRFNKVKHHIENKKHSYMYTIHCCMGWQVSLHYIASTIVRSLATDQVANKGRDLLVDE